MDNEKKPVFEFSFCLESDESEGFIQYLRNGMYEDQAQVMEAQFEKQSIKLANKNKS